jgi:hypothetical protein
MTMLCLEGMNSANPSQGHLLTLDPLSPLQTRGTMRNGELPHQQSTIIDQRHQKHQQERVTSILRTEELVYTTKTGKMWGLGCFINSSRLLYAQHDGKQSLYYCWDEGVIPAKINSEQWPNV